MRTGIRSALRSALLTALLAALLTASASAALREMQVPLSPGLFYTELTEDAPGSYEQYYALDYHPGQGTVASVLSADEVWGRDDPEKLLSEKQNGAVAAINSDFFTMSTGVPEGILIRDGELYCSDSWQNAVGILPDGRIFIGRPEMVMWLKNIRNALQISYINKTRTKAGLYLYNSRYGGEEHITGSGTNVLLRVAGPGTLHVGDVIRCRVESIRQEDGVPAVEAGYLLLSCSAAGPADKLAGLREGDLLTLTLTCRDSRWEEVTYACGANIMLVEDGQVKSGLSTRRRACTALGLREDGSVVMLAGDGRVKGSIGTSHALMAEKLVSMGCVTAVNLDGGGSTTLIARWPGTTERTVMNLPSDGSVRPCTAYITFENGTAATGRTSMLFLRPTQAYALPGAKVAFRVTATDDTYHPAELGNYALTAGGGAIAGTTLTAPASGTVAVQAVAPNARPARASVQVLDRVDVIRIRENGVDLKEIILLPGESVDLYAVASYNGKWIYTTDRAFTWTLKGGVGTVTAEGVVTVSGVPGETGKLTVSYGTRSWSIRVIVRFPPEPDPEEAQSSAGQTRNPSDTRAGDKAARDRR